jgi:hypothetical protein
MPKMKKNTLLTVVVISVCFLIGVLTYSGTKLFVDFLKSQIETCEKPANHCQKPEREMLKY